MKELLVLSGGTVASMNGVDRVDVIIEGSKIMKVGGPFDIESEAVTRIDCTGKLLLPGGVDVHTHLESVQHGTVTSDDFESGTRAALAGGTTTLIDFAMQRRGHNLLEELDAHAGKARPRALIDYGFHLVVTDLYDGAAHEFREMSQSGVTSLKVFMAYPGEMMLRDGDLYDVFRKASSASMQVCVHAENGDVIERLASDLYRSGRTGPKSHLLSRPPETEVEAIERAIKLSRMADASIYFVHVSTQGGVEAIADAQSRDWSVSGETCTHYLTLGPELYDADDFGGARAVLTPPLRSRSHREALWRGLSEGSLGVVSSDHCPFCFEGQKDLGRDDFRKIPNGGPGIEHRMILMYSEGVRRGRISIEKFVELTSTGPAKRFGIHPQKGSIQAGADADIVVLDPSGTTKISARHSLQNVDYTLWEGWSADGRIESVYSRGDRVYHEGVVDAIAGRGQFLKRACVS